MREGRKVGGKGGEESVGFTVKKGWLQGGDGRQAKRAFQGKVKESISV